MVSEVGNRPIMVAVSYFTAQKAERFIVSRKALNQWSESLYSSETMAFKSLKSESTTTINCLLIASGELDIKVS